MSEKRHSLLATRSGALLPPGSARYWYRLAPVHGIAPINPGDHRVLGVIRAGALHAARSMRNANPSSSENDVGRGPSPERPRPTQDATPPREVEQFVESPPSGPCVHRATLNPRPRVLARGDSVKDCTGSPSWPTPRTLLLMWSQREVIDYALQRRSTLEALRRPGRRLARQEACDADPMLVRAAKHHGEPSSMPCPVCDADDWSICSYVFGEQLGQYSGRIKRTLELEEMAHEFGEFKVVVVEVCRTAAGTT